MTNNPFGSNPFETVFKDLMNAMASQSNLSSSIAEQFAMSVVARQTGDENADPLLRMKVESLFDLAQRNISNDSIISKFILEQPSQVLSLSQVEYVQVLLGDLHELIAKLESISKDASDSFPKLGGDPQIFGGLPFSQMSAIIGPFLSGMNVGSCVGHLAQENLASFDILLPRKLKSIAFVAQNIQNFSTDWNLNLDELIIWLSVQQITLSAILSLPHIAKIIDDAIDLHLESAQKMSQSLTKRFEDVDMSDPDALAKLTSDPTQLIGIELSELQELQLQNTSKALAVIIGIADYITSTTARRLLGNFEQIVEAVRRKRIESHEGETLFESLFGISVRGNTYELGHKFIFGVIERNEEDRLISVLESPWAFPTPNEVDAPGLWIARLESTSEMPDSE